MRTEQSAPTVATNGKWRANFVTYNGQPGNEYVANTCGSAPVFATEDEAYEGGTRALNMLESTGKFPNMCEVF